MSDANSQPPKTNPLKTQPIKKTSAVPLRKETVRVTLKAPGARPGVPVAPSASPTIPLGGGAPKPTAPMTPASAMSPATEAVTTKVDLPDVTSAVPLKQETMRVTLKADGSGAPAAPAPAPTIPLGGGAPPARPAPAPTIPLGGGAPRPVAAEPTVKLSGGGAATPGVALTQPLQKAGSSQPLPKATVQLQQTQQLTQGLGAPSQAATIQTVVEEDVESRRGSKAALPLSIIAFVITLVIGFFAFKHAAVWVEKPSKGGNESGDYSRLFEAAE